MTEWYVPITILPVLSLLIVSTSGSVANLSNEIAALIKENYAGYMQKIDQLTRLNKGMCSLYFSGGALMPSGILQAALAEIMIP
ncbi:MAG: hypothetical protein AAGC88_12415 [Bacteroidota bacterium]